MKAEEILKKYWGFDSFRLNQSDIVSSVINGHDTFALLPTGGGKSICFQVPALAREGICIVVSPLIALMQDQVKNLQNRGIKAYAITSGMTRREIDIILDNCKFGNVKFLYVSPERLKTDLFLTRFKQMKVGLIAIDEAHCISEWGHDFRPPYLEIYQLREIHQQVPMIALTATATERVKEDIITQLHLKNTQVFEGDFARSNISYEVYQVENKTDAILKACKRFDGLSGIIYCQTRRATKEVARLLLAQRFSAGIYNGGMDNDERKKQLQLWMEGKIKIMVATNAFGMGIDKPDVRFVLHYEIPNNLEAYFQEAGRSGRDGKASRNLAFYEVDDLFKMKERFTQQFPPIAFIKTIYRALCNYLGIAIGSGANESYPLNMGDFIAKYNLEPLPTYNALKILELNHSIVLNEAVFHPTRIKIAVENKTLYNFQIKYEKYDPLITLLCRSYPGIFENYFIIHEKELAKRLNCSFQELEKQLIFIEKQGLIDIVWRSDLPQITFPHERLPDDYLSINKEVYDTRKKVANDKLNGMLRFLKTPLCRSVLLLEYFGQKGKPCGKCDVCLSEKKSVYTHEELKEYIISILKEKKELSFDAIASELNIQETGQLKKILFWLIDEEIVQFNNATYSISSSFM
jgi:ATP-dependent DNA helicase RecQ